MTKFPRAAAVESTARPIQLTDRQAFIRVLEIINSVRRTGKSLFEQMFYETSLRKLIDDGRTKYLTRQMSLEPQP